MKFSALERLVIDGLPGIDPDKVGDILGVGAQCVVRSYDAGPDRQVIKFPFCQVRRGVYAHTMGRVLGQHHDQAKAEIDTCAEYFEPFMVRTRIVRGERDGLFCIVQDRIDLTEITRETLAAGPHLNSQLGEILEANRRMMAEQGKWLDAMGWKFAKFIRYLTNGTPYLENIGLDVSTQKLRLFDFGLFPMPDKSRRPMRSYYRFLLRIQQRNMGRFGHSFSEFPKPRSR